MRNFSYESTVLFGVLFSVGIWYEIRIMYALCFILIFYWLFFGYWKDFWKHKEKYALLAGVVVLLNAFWILPSAFGVSESLEAATSRGVTDTGSGILNSMTNYNDKWSGELVVQSFSGASIPWWAWVGPILAFSVLAYFKKIRSKKDGKNILFFAFVTLFGLLLSKQGDPPFGGLFDWLYDNFPGFSVYRVGARFLFIVALGYTGLLAYSIKYLIVENKKIHVYAKNGMLVFLSVVFLWNAKPLVTKEVGNLFVNKIEPTEYQVLNDFISSQDGFFRTAWFPRPSVWGYFSNEKPRINMSSVAKKELKNFYDLDRSDDFNVFHPFKTSYGNDLADFSGIKYFIIPMADDQDEMLYVEGDKSRNKLVSEIKNLDFLEKVELEGLGDILVYENKGVRPHIFLLRDIYDNVSEKELPSIRFERISPTKKKVKIIGAKGSFYVVMSEKYNPGWKLTREQMGFLRAINPGDAKGVVFDDRQERFLGFLNAWRVDSSEICENTKCQKNNDGTVDLNLTIEFWPQRWYHLGILVTLVSLGLVLIFLIYSRLTENKK
ncbi:MAG: hypothetical protein OEV93_03900 [Candidatus Moranbacteria bacterium]|nr:hypothetical protein [Candidatus Moranbacteria bacterium]